MGGVIPTLSLGLTVGVASAGAVTSVFALRAVRHTPLERPVVAIGILFVGLALYHLLLLVYPTHWWDLQVVESLTYTAMTAFVLVVVYLQTRIDGGFTGVRR